MCTAKQHKVPLHLVLCTVLVAGAQSVIQYRRVVSEEKVFQRLFALQRDDLATFPFCLLDDSSSESLFSVAEVNLTPSAYENILYTRNMSALDVQVQFSVLKIIAVSERDQNVMADVRTETTWTDCRLAWLPAEFNMVTNVTIPPERFRSIGLFVPTVYMREETSQLSSTASEVRVHLYSSGKITIEREYGTTISCDLDLEMYPFDHHTCSFTFETQYNSLDVNLTYRKAATVEEESWHLLAHGRYTPNRLWEVVILPPVKTRRQICSGVDPHSNQSLHCQVDRQTFKMVLARHPTYQVINLFTPAFLCMIVSASIYIIPNGASDKTFLMLCILLSTFWFAISIYDKMPDTGDKLSWMSIYYFVVISIISLNCIVCAISATVGSSKVRVPPGAAKFVRFLACALLPDMLDTKKTRRKSTASNVNVNVNNNLNSHHQLETAELADLYRNENQPACLLELDERESQLPYEVTWQHVSACLDRIYFILLLIFSACTLLVFVVSGYVQPSSYYAKHLSPQDWPYVDAQMDQHADFDLLKKATRQ